MLVVVQITTTFSKANYYVWFKLKTISKPEDDNLQEGSFNHQKMSHKVTQMSRGKTKKINLLFWRPFSLL